jgi:hypothetical protein
MVQAYVIIFIFVHSNTYPSFFGILIGEVIHHEVSVGRNAQ